MGLAHTRVTLENTRMYARIKYAFHEQNNSVLNPRAEPM